MTSGKTRATGVLGAALLCLSVAASSGAQTRPRPGRSGAELYAAACAACHGNDGTGADVSRVGFDTPLPDFTDCSFATREPFADWFAIAHSGGPVRAFDKRMPAFGEALSEAELERTVDHVQRFCADDAWPRGELNLPRPLVTEKAYPEDEAVVTTLVSTGDTRQISNVFLYERRFGARTQAEIAVPVAAQRGIGGDWQRGLGDVAFAVKRVLAHSLRRGSIVSVSGEVVLPTGKETQGLGKGTTVFEPFLTFGQLLPRNGFLHAQAGVELPRHRDVAEREGFWRLALGQTFEQGQFGRAWSPMIELLGARELESGATTNWDVLPQVQVTLSRRQHIMINGGIRVPLSNRSDRDVQVLTYLLWDWYDGGFLDGWR
jgi:mono/diheme cytochrome c family protein